MRVHKESEVEGNANVDKQRYAHHLVLPPTGCPACLPPPPPGCPPPSPRQGCEAHNTSGYTHCSPAPASLCLTSSASLVAASRADLGMKRFVGTAAAPSRCLPISASASSSVAAALRLQSRKRTRELKQGGHKGVHRVAATLQRTIGQSTSWLQARYYDKLGLLQTGNICQARQGKIRAASTVMGTVISTVTSTCNQQK